jgi:hypothetical protein
MGFGPTPAPLAPRLYLTSVNSESDNARLRRRTNWGYTRNLLIYLIHFTHPIQFVFYRVKKLSNWI